MPRLLTGCLFSLISVCSFAASTETPRDLVTAFWNSGSDPEIQTARVQLQALAPDVGTLYDWLKTGPTYSIEVPRGVVNGERIAADGTAFPYAVLIPESYDPGKAYPVEFLLHGGVSRPAPAAGDTFWRGGYDTLKRDDRIMVVPAAWREALWWQANQAENLPAILRELKQRYNVDENQVSLTGVSDGGTGAYFFAFKQPTHWSAFFPYIGHPGVLRNAGSGGGYQLYFENLTGKPLYIVNGEEDPLYPAASLGSFIQILEDQGVNHVFQVIEGGGHNTRWLPEEAPRIEAFKAAHPRDPYPDSVQWVADRADRYSRNHWIRIDALSRAGRPSLLQADRQGNEFRVTARGVNEFTLLLNPEEVNLAEPVQVIVNDEELFNDIVSQSADILLDWAGRELDRHQLYTAELTLTVAD